MSRRDNALMILAAVVAVGLMQLVLPAIQDGLRMAEPEIIRAQVRLINTCPLADSSFAVRNTDTGRSVPFSNGTAQIEAERGTYLQVVLASRFKDVTFDGEKQRIRVRMTMTADCSQGERMRGVMDGLGDKFGN